MNGNISNGGYNRLQFHINRSISRDESLPLGTVIRRRYQNAAFVANGDSQVGSWKYNNQ